MRTLLSIPLLILCLLLSASCNGQSGEKETEVLLQTTKGDIRIRLFNDTPGHRDNFIKNVRAGLYDGVTFHRVIRSFMVQTGDPSTRVGHEGDTIQPDSTIPAEFVFPKYFHHRGVVAAAREGDDINPQKASDAKQFYIVTGKFQGDEALTGIEQQRQQQLEQTIYDKKMKAHADEAEALRKARKMDDLSDLLEKLQDEARLEASENPPLTFTPEQRRAYRTEGGAPWLDADYTVFGEVVEGMKAVLEIEKAETDKNDKPLQDIRIVKATVVE